VSDCDGTNELLTRLGVGALLSPQSTSTIAIV
jgi:hypothetical protein